MAETNAPAKWVSASCGGETCHIGDCDKVAFAKVGEEILHDDPAPGRHNLTAYVCEEHFKFIFGERGAHFRNRWIENRAVCAAIAATEKNDPPQTPAPPPQAEEGKT